MPKRTDANQTEIVNAARKLGATVQILSGIGKGCPDIVIGYKGINYLVEIKDGSKSLSQQKLTDAELRFFNTWRGQVCIIRSLDEIIKLLT